MPDFLADKENINYDITDTIVVKNMIERKKIFFDLGDAFLILPGGSGTIEEATEIISWRILSIHEKPIIIFNYNNYWKSFLELYDNAVKNNFGNKNLQSICKIVRTPKEFKLLFN